MSSLFAALAVLWFGFTASAGAALVVGGANNRVVAAYNVNVGGALYDVTLQYGSCLGIFIPCDASKFTFTTEAYGIAFAAPIPSWRWRRLSDAETCRDLLRDAGFEDIEVHVEQLGTYLKDTEEWWDIVCDVNFQSPVSQLAAEPAQRFKAEHLSEVSALATSHGIWLNLPAIFAVGRKPGVAA